MRRVWILNLWWNSNQDLDRGGLLWLMSLVNLYYGLWNPGGWNMTADWFGMLLLVSNCHNICQKYRQNHYLVSLLIYNLNLLLDSSVNKLTLISQFVSVDCIWGNQLKRYFHSSIMALYCIVRIWLIRQDQ